MRMASLRRSLVLLLGLFVLRPVNGEVCSPVDQMWNGVRLSLVMARRD